MTRDEHRKKCFEAMEKGYWDAFDKSDSVRDYLIAAFDALNGIAFVDPIEATDEMLMVAEYNTPSPYEINIRDMDSFANMIRRIAAAGNLTNPPETKP